MSSLGEKLKSLRKNKKLTMEQLADSLNKIYNTKINKGMISKWENNLGEPSLDNIRTLASFYTVSLDYLLDINVEEKENLVIAAHHDGEDWTQEELDELESFKLYVLSKRKNN